MSNHNVHESFSQRDAVKTSSNRSFGIVFAVVFGIVGLAPFFWSGTIRWWAVVVAALFLALSLLYPKILAPLNRLWTRFGLLLHRIVNPIVMGFLFFLVVTPIGLLMRTLGKRPLNIDFDPEAKSYWIERQPPGPTPETMKQQF